MSLSRKRQISLGNYLIRNRKSNFTILVLKFSSKDYNDLGFLAFDLDVNLEPLFNWNVKQLFLYLTAEYETESNKLNQVVLWDKIVLRGDDPHFSVKAIRNKYHFWDDGNGLK